MDNIWSDKGWNGTRVRVGKRVVIHTEKCHRLPTGTTATVIAIVASLAVVELVRVPGKDCPWKSGDRLSAWVWWLEGETLTGGAVTMVLTDRELASLLAGVRLLARLRDTNPAEWEIATNGGTIEPLSVEEMESLCAKLHG